MNNKLVRALPAHEAGMYRLMSRTEGDAGPMRISVTRSPSVERSYLNTGSYAAQTLVLVDESDAVVGMSTRSVADYMVADRVRCIGYLSDLRIDSVVRKKKFLRSGYAEFAALHEKDEAKPEWYLSSVMGNNDAMLDLISTKRPSMPWYSPIGVYTTCVLRPRWGASNLKGLKVTVTQDDDAVCDVLRCAEFFRKDCFVRPCYQYAPWLLGAYAVSMESECFALRTLLLDVNQEKQIRLSYSTLGKIVRTVSGLSATLGLHPPLPPSGTALQHGYLYAMSYVGNQKKALSALLKIIKTIPQFASKWIIGGEMCGSTVASSLCELATVVVHSKMFAVSWEKKVEAPSLHIEVVNL